MNERIKSLLNVCGMPNGDLMEIYSDVNKSFYMEQFAELIVRECAKCITTGTYSADPPYDKIIPVLLDVLTNNMMQHFGVEE